VVVNSSLTGSCRGARINISVTTPSGTTTLFNPVTLP
jgi:hypothetical protein